MNIKSKFYRWLFEVSKKAVREDHLKSVGNDILCPNCNEWFSISGVEYRHEHVTKPEWGFHIKCGKCSKESYWNAYIAPVLILSDDRGDPLK